MIADVIYDGALVVGVVASGVGLVLVVMICVGFVLDWRNARPASRGK